MYGSTRRYFRTRTRYFRTKDISKVRKYESIYFRTCIEYFRKYFTFVRAKVACRSARNMRSKYKGGNDESPNGCKRNELREKLATLFGDDSDDEQKYEGAHATQASGDTDGARKVVMSGEHNVSDFLISKSEMGADANVYDTVLLPAKGRIRFGTGESARPNFGSPLLPHSTDSHNGTESINVVANFKDQKPLESDGTLIDDLRLNTEFRWGVEEDDESPVVSEAEEEDGDLNRIFEKGKGTRRKRLKRSEAVIASDVLNFLARMEVATEKDRDCIDAKKPAIFKLKLLNEVREKLTEVDLHESFLRHGLLKVLAQWLALLPDNNLPNTTVRTTIINCIHQLPIETDLNDRKEELKHSGLGRIIMFLSKLPEETPANRKKCKDLVEKWSRPVYELSSQYRDMRHQVDDDPVHFEPRKKVRRESNRGGNATEERDVAEHAQVGPRFGEAGYRYHAVVPEPESMEYVIQPKLLIDPCEIKARTQSADQQRVRKLVNKVAKKSGIKDGKAYLPSVEGRGMITYH
jgi:transcription factor SPN1